jgi:hypothetical protein
MAAPAPDTFESFAVELGELVARFDRQYLVHRSPDYNEATLRADFLDPFFRALGWDVGNTKALIHTERRLIFMSGDVINEQFEDFLRRHGRTCLNKPFAIGRFRAAVAGIVAEGP